jgi:hypothetical protein
MSKRELIETNGESAVRGATRKQDPAMGTMSAAACQDVHKKATRRTGQGDRGER